MAYRVRVCDSYDVYSGYTFRVEVERGERGQGGYINSVQGGFQ